MKEDKEMKEDTKEDKEEKEMKEEKETREKEEKDKLSTVCVIVKNIEVDPNMIRPGLKKLIEEELDKIDICTMKNGYIKSKKIISIQSNALTKISNKISFRVTFEAETFLPTKGMVINAIINNIFPSGIFLEYEKVKILIPHSNLEMNGYELSPHGKENRFKKIKGGDDLTVKKNISIVLQDSRFEKRKFLCIAFLNV